MSELAGFAANILEQHVKLKRVQQIGNVQNKRMRRLSPTGHAIQPRYCLLVYTQPVFFFLLKMVFAGDAICHFFHLIAIDCLQIFEFCQVGND